MSLGTCSSIDRDDLQDANLIGDARRFGQDLGELADPKPIRDYIMKVVVKGDVGVKVLFRGIGLDRVALGAFFGGVGDNVSWKGHHCNSGMVLGHVKVRSKGPNTFSEWRYGRVRKKARTLE